MFFFYLLQPSSGLNQKDKRGHRCAKSIKTQVFFCRGANQNEIQIDQEFDTLPKRMGIKWISYTKLKVRIMYHRTSSLHIVWFTLFLQEPRGINNIFSAKTNHTHQLVVANNFLLSLSFPFFTEKL